MKTQTQTQTQTQKSYSESVHRIGRLGSLGTILIMLGIPAFITYYYGLPLNISEILLVSSGLLALFVPIAIAEVISYMPALGSASYITFMTGNVMNLKLPVALNASEITGAKQGTEERDVIVTMAISISSIVTMAILALGVVLLVPLEPLFSLPVVQTATSYMLPALFGGMFLPMLLNNTAGDYKVKGKLLPTVLPLIAVVIINQFIFPLQGLEGIVLLTVIPITIIIARLLYKKNVIKMYKE